MQPQHASTAPRPAIDPRILDEAAEWLVQLQGGGATEAQRQACAQWQRTSPEHGRAWARAELLVGTLGGLPPALAKPALQRNRAAERRAALGKLAALLAVAPAGWLAWRVTEAQGWTATHRTATGERREVLLADGSKVVMNTGTALDVAFDATERLLHLRSGEILIETAADPRSAHRPFRVRTAHGTLQALGTRFSVRQVDGDGGSTHLAVLEGAVQVQPRRAAAAQAVVRAGQAIAFTADGVGEAHAAEGADTAWTQGMLLAYKMPLAQFVAELSRYRRGLLACDPALAALPVSGAYPVDDTDRALAMLVATYPVAAATRLAGYWVTLVPRGYHPVAAVHGYDLYYLNVMAGPLRKWRFIAHPDHAWISESPPA